MGRNEKSDWLKSTGQTLVVLCIFGVTNAVGRVEDPAGNPVGHGFRLERCKAMPPTKKLGRNWEQPKNIWAFQIRLDIQPSSFNLMLDRLFLQGSSRAIAAQKSSGGPHDPDPRTDSRKHQQFPRSDF
jgi:hypothetical protein